MQQLNAYEHWRFQQTSRAQRQRKCERRCRFHRGEKRASPDAATRCVQRWPGKTAPITTAIRKHQRELLRDELLWSIKCSHRRFGPGHAPRPRSLRPSSARLQIGTETACEKLPRLDRGLAARGCSMCQYSSPGHPCWCLRTIRSVTGARNNLACDHHRHAGSSTRTSNSPRCWCCWQVPFDSWTAEDLRAVRSGDAHPLLHLFKRYPFGFWIDEEHHKKLQHHHQREKNEGISAGRRR
jgi:hypothetical protein